MSYNYETQKSELFGDQGQRVFLAVRDEVQRLLKIAGAFREVEVQTNCSGGDTWMRMACLDRLVELKEIEVVRDTGWRQYRVYSTSQIHNR